MIAATLSCPGCGATVPEADEVRLEHLYVGAAPGCWAAYMDMVGGTMADPATADLHMLAADAYPAQHPGVPGRQSSQSVWVHLVGLCLALEHGFDGVGSARAKARLATPDTTFEWLAPPTDLGPVTVFDVLEARAGGQAAAVRRWAESVWTAWSPHHAAIRRRAASLLESPGRPGRTADS